MVKEELIQLPEPDKKGNVPLEEVIQKRRSVRSFSEKELTLQQTGQLLWACQGIIGSRVRRSAPSAGALYPLEVYAATKDGFFHYLPVGHSLEVVTRDDIRKKLMFASWGQGFVGAAAADIVICAEYSRVCSKYGKRGERYVHMEAGHAAQNVHLEAAGLGLASVPVGAFIDRAVKKVCLLPKQYDPLYIIPIGYAKEK